jgi:hypothetical protein
MRSGVACVAAGMLLLAAGCTEGVEPNGSCSDLRIAVDGGATVRLRWDADCRGDGLSAPYRERPAGGDDRSAARDSAGPAIAE